MNAPMEATTVIPMPYAPIQMEDIPVLASMGTPVQGRIVQVCICHQVGKIFHNSVMGPLNPELRPRVIPLELRPFRVMTFSQKRRHFLEGITW